ncbi:D-tyrosyl-tRNA(Tyr) deacylase [Candidatus Pacearchaeota archaeon]|nr:D-tyrosyl-tRNA(Tyr) deacylase [Candidatus Pacearchaeota archaeon]
MRALIQRVSKAKVTVDGEVTGEIEKGILVLLGITHEDTNRDVDVLLEKIINLRIFPSEKSGFDHSLQEVGGSLLVVSQFTLHGSTKKGRRPDFTASAKPEMAEPLYDSFILNAQNKGINVASGRFGAMMDVELVNEGPVTLMIESK